MHTAPSVTVRSIAFLDSFCKEHGVPSTTTVEVPSAGITAIDLAGSIGLPLELIEGVFHNYSVSGLDAIVMPGDRVAFVPPGTPASHPAFFGRFVTRL
jgi:molybdopterin converting factor small subunit